MHCRYLFKNVKIIITNKRKKRKLYSIHRGKCFGISYYSIGKICVCVDMLFLSSHNINIRFDEYIILFLKCVYGCFSSTKNFTPHFYEITNNFP